MDPNALHATRGPTVPSPRSSKTNTIARVTSLIDVTRGEVAEFFSQVELNNVSWVGVDTAQVFGRELDPFGTAAAILAVYVAGQIVAGARSTLMIRYDDAVGAPVEEVAQAQPDLILAANSGITEAEYEKLSKLGVPVVAYPGKAWMTSWRDSLDMIGKALGRNKLADEVEADVEETLAEAKQEHPNLVGKSHFVSWIDPTDTSSIGVYGDSRATVLTEVGLTQPEWVEDITKGEAYGTVSAERAATLEADLALLTAESKAEADKIAGDKLIAKIPAVAEGNVWWDLPDHSTAYALDVATPLSLPYMTEHLLPELDKVLAEQ